MEQFELNLQPILRRSHESAMNALEYLKMAKVDSVNARSTQEAYGNNISRFLAMKSLEKEAKNTMDNMAAFLHDTKTVIEMLDMIKEISEKMMTVAMDWNTEAALCLKKLAFQDLSDLRMPADDQDPEEEPDE